MRIAAYITVLLFALTACQPVTSPAIEITPQTKHPTDLPQATETTSLTPASPTRKTQPVRITDSPGIPASQGQSCLATTFPNPNRFTWKLVAKDLKRPVGVLHAGDSTGRLFIIEQPGIIRILKDGQVIDNPFLDIRQQVGSEGNEQGLLGLAFHPAYLSNGYFFVNYTDLNGDTIISRYRVSPENPDQADQKSETRVLWIEQPYSNHNGGAMAFGPDGLLYLGLGDGGSAGDPLGNAQSGNSLLGKILRIDPDKIDQMQSLPDNRIAEIYALGLRNPWRFSFDRLTGDLYIGDVGQNQWEEIDYLSAGTQPGVNLGWNYYEGTHLYQEGVLPENSQLVKPIYEYDHRQGCSVTGGVVYRGENLPEWYGVYLFGDFCSGNITGLLNSSQGVWQELVLYENIGRISSFGENEAGEIFLVDLSGNIYILARAD